MFILVSNNEKKEIEEYINLEAISKITLYKKKEYATLHSDTKVLTADYVVVKGEEYQKVLEYINRKVNKNTTILDEF